MTKKQFLLDMPKSVFHPEYGEMFLQVCKIFNGFKASYKSKEGVYCCVASANDYKELNRDLTTLLVEFKLIIE
jgi:hypothetical protein